MVASVSPKDAVISAIKDAKSVQSKGAKPRVIRLSVARAGMLKMLDNLSQPDVLLNMGYVIKEFKEKDLDAMLLEMEHKG